MMEKNRIIQDEHEKYFFGYSSSEVYNTIEESVKNCVRHLMEECEKAVIEEHAGKNVDKIARDIADMEALYMRGCMDVLGDFKGVLRNIFSIPENASIYPKTVKKTYTEDEVKTLREEVGNLEQEFLREKMYLANLKKEMEMLETLSPSLLNTKMILDHLKGKTEADNTNKLNRINQKLEDWSRKMNLQIQIDESTELAEDLGLLS